MTKQDTSPLPDFLADLQKRVLGELRTDEYSRTLYSTDASLYQVMPLGVLIPKTADDMQAAVELAAKYKIPVLPRSSGTSLVGQAVNEALVIDSTPHLNQVLEVNTEEKWVLVQPGVVLDKLNQSLRPLGLKFGPDPASSNRSAMGGIVANNSTGSHSILYGMTADHVLETRTILADGSVTRFGFLSSEEVRAKGAAGGFEGQLYDQIRTITNQDQNKAIIQANTPRHWRRCGGYNADRLIGGEGVTFHIPQDHRFNLAKLMCGSEGTLGIMSEIKLNLVPIPERAAIAIVHFNDLKTALSTVPIILETMPSAVEVIDNIGLTRCMAAPQYARLMRGFIEGTPDCVLITEFYGESESELNARLSSLKQILRASAATSIREILDPAVQKDVWEVRKVALGFLMSVEGDFKPVPFIEDAGVPVEHLAEYVSKVEQFCNNLGTQVAYYAHASAGCLHIRPMVNTKMAEEIAKLPQIIDFAVDLLHGNGGALSSEHGDGRARSWANQKFFGPDLYNLYKQIKVAFDPDNILNPGNIVDAGPMTENLRYGADYAVMPLQTHLDFSEFGSTPAHGFDRAVEQCNGAGVCRKEGVGAMCPSYMVTRDEEHSTRGRANALRAALAGILPPGALTDQRMYEIMDLCVSCKSCKAECPSAVDMAKLKFEFLAHYHEKHGIPLRSRLFGSISALSRIASGPWAPLINAILKSPATRSLLDRLLGISHHRVLPEFASQPFTRWFRKHQKAAAPLDGETVVLFNDTFNTYNTPEVAISAVEVFEAAGFKVVLPGHRCCGRPYISKGMVAQARRAARHTVDRLYPFAAQGLPIVGLEPSCLLSMRDEYHYLLPGDPKVQVVSDHCYTFEEFINKLDREGKLNLSLSLADAHLVMHSHCQARALVGAKCGEQTLNLIPGVKVEALDSGCCGMAGSFGYESEHYPISIKMGEDRLFPAVQNADDDTIIVAAGTSCRHQIEDGVGRHALHPAQVLRQALEEKGND
ncbi:MAG: FAD-binding and (Fe-S)-binding domain-containing protein [Anaerolineales bacterium]